MVWLEPITDRTQADVEAVKALKNKIIAFGWDALSANEKAAWLSGSMKGAHNYTDFNRIGLCINYLANTLTAYGYPVTIVAKTDWSAGDEISSDNKQQYLTDTQSLIDAYYKLSTTPAIPNSVNFWGFADANNIEQILADIKTVIGRMEAGFRYCGTFYCGQEVILP